MAELYEVFRLSGVPTVTFVQPAKYQEILVSVKTPGRCLILEGPSGIGKSTTIEKVLEETGTRGASTILSARRPDDLPLIQALPEMGDLGTVIVDDFHRLPDETKATLSDFMKVLADASSEHSKLILIGINKAGHQLVKYANDLGLRLDVFRLEANSDEKVEELISLGETALNIEFAERSKIAERAEGSFQIAQLLCHKLCVLSGVVDTKESKRLIDKPLDVAVEDVMVDLGRMFKDPVVTFAQGSKIRREGRAPYLHMLKWLSEGDEWSLDLREAMNRNPTHKQSIGQVLDKGFLVALLEDPEKIKVLSPNFHFESSTSILSVEDPKLIFYLKNLVWRAFTRQVGYTTDYFEGSYDYALSFAGPEREHAKRLHEILTDREVSVFYDENEQHRIIANDVEEYLAPIYRSEARYVVPMLSVNYPNRIWTKFESDNFRERFGEGAVIPVRYRDTQPGFISEEQRYGSLSFDPSGDVESQLQAIADLLCKRLVEDKEGALFAVKEKAEITVDYLASTLTA